VHTVFPYEMAGVVKTKNLCNHLHTTQKNALYLRRGTHLHYENVQLLLTDIVQHPTAAFSGTPLTTHWRKYMAAKKPAAKKPAAKKPAAKKPAAKKPAAKKPAAKKPAAKKPAAKKPAAKKPAAKKPAAKKPAAKKPAAKRKPNAAFMKPMTPSGDLAAVVGASAIPRTEVTKKLWDYIKKNKLQDAVNRRMINADEKLKAVFGGKKVVSMFEMTKLVAAHLK
jgi:chromatin remodeling complex protein RSC6